MVKAEPPEYRAPATEWPTVALAAVIYGGWLGLTAWHAALPWPALLAGGAWLIAWQGSLQHEVIHGHPTRHRWINLAIGFVPLALWLPYATYAREHAAHHATGELTDPFDDPESNYLPRAGGLAHGLAWIDATLAGRMVFGPLIRIVRFWLAEVRDARTDPARVAREWLPHLAGVAVILSWLHHVGLSPLTYGLCFVWPGTSLALIRSYAEHRASPDPAARTAIVADFGPMALLFLNNNLHAWHHARPALPWYALPALYRADPEAFPLAPRYPGYGTLIARHLLRPYDRLVHPGPGPGPGRA
jgi:fatty acid desaturase